MAMRPCEKCFENYWSFRKLEEYVYATCNHCGNEVSWIPSPKFTDTGRSSCKCGSNRVVLRKARITAKKLTRQYYFTHSWQCLDCKKFYLDERFKKNML